MNKLILMMGASGSGKSTYAYNLSLKIAETAGRNPNIFSNDDFFTSYTREQKYKWIADLHKYSVMYCLGRAAKACADDEFIVIVDNTHTNMEAIRPYIHLAEKTGYDLEIHEPNTYWQYSADECFKRNTHGVPFDTIKAMICKIQSLKSSGLIDKYLRV